MRGRLSAAAAPSPGFETDWVAGRLAGLERLNGPAGAPVAVALSGGGDSLALLWLAQAWAERTGRRLVALTVDHQLQPASAAWSRFAADRAGRLGVEHRTLAWTAPKPDRGLPAAARAARHALLAAAARAVGAHVILMGHTADDLAEAEAMRRDGSATPSPRLWAPSPAWPDGRGVFLLRPLLGVRRAELRRMLSALGETWIDDPANDDERYARARARRTLTPVAAATPHFAESTPAWPGLDRLEVGVGGELTVARCDLVASAEARRALAALAVCCGGGARPPSTAAVDRLLARLARPGDVVATLAGARIEAHGERVLICRETGDQRRVGLGDVDLPVGETVFDGRFVVTTTEPGWRLGPLQGRMSRLSRRARPALARLPAAVRGGLPAMVSPRGEVMCPLLEETPGVRVSSPVGQRVCATLGAFADEAALWRVAKLPRGP